MQGRLPTGGYKLKKKALIDLLRICFRSAKTYFGLRELKLSNLTERQCRDTNFAFTKGKTVVFHVLYIMLLQKKGSDSLSGNAPDFVYLHVITSGFVLSGSAVIKISRKRLWLAALIGGEWRTLREFL